MAVMVIVTDIIQGRRMGITHIQDPKCVFMLLRQEDILIIIKVIVTVIMVIKIVVTDVEKVVAEVEAMDVDKNKNAFSNGEGIFIFYHKEHFITHNFH